MNYEIITTIQDKAGWIDSNCADITFYNTGVSPVNINQGIVLTTGQEFEISAQKGETDRTRYQIFFTNTAVKTELTIVKKVYRDK